MPDDGGAGGEGAEQHAGPGQGELMGDLKYKTSDLLAAIPDEEQDESTRKFEQEVLVSYPPPPRHRPHLCPLFISILDGTNSPLPNLTRRELFGRLIWDPHAT